MRTSSKAGLAAVASLTAGVAAILVMQNGGEPIAQAADLAPEPVLIAAAGRVEPVSEEVTIASQIPGRLAEVRVEEGNRVRRDQILAVIDNADFVARTESAEALLRLRQAELDRVRNGAREQERREAKAAVAEARAVLENARADMERREALHRSGDLSRAEAERTAREFNVSQARYEAALERSALVHANARDEDIARAEAEVAAAAAQVREARAIHEKTLIRSPLDGVVLRKYRRTGESVADGPEQPILLLGDNRKLRVRVEVDETEIARIHLGQRAYVRADAFGDQKFWGNVVRLGQVLGRKNVRTDASSERVDTKVLETLLELEDARLPAGLRVDAYLIVN